MPRPYNTKNNKKNNTKNKKNNTKNKKNNKKKKSNNQYGKNCYTNTLNLAYSATRRNRAR